MQVCIVSYYFIICTLSCSNLTNSRVLYAYLKSGIEESLEKHRFLILSKVIEDSEYHTILNNPPQQRQDEVSSKSDTTLFLLY